MFKKNFVRLCNIKREAPTYVLKQIGLSNAAFSTWTDETIPRQTTLMKLADYFGVSVDYLLGRDTESEQKEKPAIESDDRLDAELIKMLCQLHPDEAARVRDFVSGLIAARKE